MKKVLSVLLAASMVMGMSVTSMAKHSWTTGAAGSVTAPVSEVLDFENKVVVERDQIDGWNKDYKIFNEGEELALEPGDNLYFPLLTAGTKTVVDKDNLICETEQHVHEDACYELDVKDDIADCGEHVHEIGVCATEPNCDIAEHNHAESGCTEVYVLEAHTHTEMPATVTNTGDVNGCWKVTWNQTKGKHWVLNCEKEEHVHDAATCETVWLCGEEEHSHDESCGERYACGFPGHIHTEDCYNADVKDETADCGKEAHTHDDSCYDTKEVPVMVYYTDVIDSKWSINIKGNEYVAAASYYSATDADKDGVYTTVWGEKFAAPYKYVKVELVDDFDSTSAKTVKFEMYIADEDYKNCETEHIIVNVSFNNKVENINKVDFDHTNDADVASTWKVAKNQKGIATFDFDSEAYFTVKMISEEKVVLNLSTAYDKAVDKLFDYEADLSFYNFKGSKDEFTKVGELFIPADEDTFIYEVVDGELVEVEATWTDEYTITDVTKEYEGWVIETKELGYYVVSDVEAEIEVEAEVEAPVEAEKANPETGAADFVGAAVAMAVVSVAAAGALALKK